MKYNMISAQRVAGALGAEIAGVDLSRPLSDEIIGEIRQALLDHQVIFFHDQHLTPEQHLAFGRSIAALNQPEEKWFLLVSQFVVELH